MTIRFSERFWDTMESFRTLWIVLAVSDLLFGLMLIAVLLLTPFDSSNPSVVVAVVDVVIVVVTLVPLLYVIRRIEQRRGY